MFALFLVVLVALAVKLLVPEALHPLSVVLVVVVEVVCRAPMLMEFPTWVW